MNILVDSLANFFTRHPTAQVAASLVGKGLIVLFAVVLIAGCLFLYSGNQSVFYYRRGSLSEKCWKAGWLLLTMSTADLTYQFFSGRKSFSPLEIVFDSIPLMLLLFAQAYGSKYHKTVQAARRDDKLKIS